MPRGVTPPCRTRRRPPPSPMQCRPCPPTKTIQAVYDAYMADPGRVRSGKSVLAYDTVFGLLIEIIGKETPISAITRETCREVMDTLRWLSPNSTKRRLNLTAREIAFVIA